jgi:hypothetical protein
MAAAHAVRRSPGDAQAPINAVASDSRRDDVPTTSWHAAVL